MITTINAEPAEIAEKTIRCVFCGLCVKRRHAAGFFPAEE